LQDWFRGWLGGWEGSDEGCEKCSDEDGGTHGGGPVVMGEVSVIDFVWGVSVVCEVGSFVFGVWMREVLVGEMMVVKCGAASELYTLPKVLSTIPL
jgi:hypothetical protein